MTVGRRLSPDMDFGELDGVWASPEGAWASEEGTVEDVEADGNLVLVGDQEGQSAVVGFLAVIGLLLDFGIGGRVSTLT